MSELQVSRHPGSVVDRHATVEQATILVIDDDPDISQAIKYRFREYDVEVLQAFHGMHGYSMAVEFLPDVIVTDLRMPQGQGDCVVECLKRNSQTRHIPIIVLTGLSDDDQRRRLDSLGIAAYLTKPVAFDDLRKEVGRFIDFSRPWRAIDGAHAGPQH